MTLGIILVLIGLVIRYFLNRAKFNRQNSAGLEGFKSYEHSVGTGILDTIGRLVGVVFLLAGALLIILSFTD